MSDLFQKFLNRVNRSYGQVDKNVFGGFLPGGASSPVSSIKKKIQQQTGVTTKALTGNLMNQLPDRVNLFGRYVTGIGNTNLQLDSSTLSGLRAAASPDPMAIGMVPNPFKVPEEILIRLEKQLETGDPRNLNSPLGDELKQIVAEGRKNRTSPDFLLRPVSAYGPGLPKSGAYQPYQNQSVGKEVTNTLGSFNAEVIPGKSIRFIDQYDMTNLSEDPDLVSGKFQPIKAIEEIQSIWNPTKGGLNRSIPQFAKDKLGQGTYGDIKTSSSSPTASPATVIGRALLYAMPWKPTPYSIDITVPY
jgi:hypothetical protein